jgi:hypothetical protein
MLLPSCCDSEHEILKLLARSHRRINGRAEMEDKELQLEKLKIWLGFWKFLLGTVVIGLVTTSVNWQIQWYQLKQEREKREQDYLAQFIAQALDENLEKRLRFAHYFSQLTLTHDAKDRWSTYYQDLLLEALGQTERRAILIEQRDNLSQKPNPSAEDKKALEILEIKIKEIDEDLPTTNPISLSSFQWSRSLINQPIAEGVSFTWGDATRNGERVPQSVQQAENIVKLAIELEKVQQQFQKPVEIVAWYRDEVTNARVGGAPNSHHVVGDAADIMIEGYTGKQIAQELDWWTGGMGLYSHSPEILHLDARGYWVRWGFDDSESATSEGDS